MPLSAVHDTIDDIPENFRELYTEKNGKFELTGIAGVKSQADVDRLQTALQKEREDHKTAKGKFEIWGDLDHEEVMSKLDRIPELEAAAADKLDEAGIEEIVTRRTEGTIKSQMAPLERQIANLSKERDEAVGLVSQFQEKETKRAIHDNVRAELTKAKVIPEAQEDALMLAERIFEVQEDGAIVTKDNVGVTPGITADAWLVDIQEKRPHWWGTSSGGGAAGGRNQSGMGFANNPWSPDHWNLTKQGQIIKEHGSEKAAQMAQAAGSKVGATRPTPKK